MSKSFFRQFGSRLQDLRQRKGFMSRELAAICNISITYISHMEAGCMWPTYDIFVRICEALEITPKDFFAAFQWKYTPPTEEKGRGVDNELQQRVA